MQGPDEDIVARQLYGSRQPKLTKRSQGSSPHMPTQPGDDDLHLLMLRDCLGQFC